MVEVTFRTADPSVESDVAATCRLVFRWRVSATRVVYEFARDPRQALGCLSGSSYVGTAARPL